MDVVYEGPGALLSGHGHGQVAAWGIVGRQWLDDTVSWYRLPTPLTAPVPARYDRVEVVLAHPRDAATGRQVWQVLRPLAQQVPVSLLPAYAGMDPTPATPAPPSKAALRARGVGQAVAGVRQAFFVGACPGVRKPWPVLGKLSRRRLAPHHTRLAQLCEVPGPSPLPIERASAGGKCG